jgi:hypothetical protein
VRSHRGPTADRRPICAQLSDVRVAIAKRLEDGHEKKGLAQDTAAGDPQRISDPAVMMLMREYRIEFGVSEQLDRSS